MKKLKFAVVLLGMAVGLSLLICRFLPDLLLRTLAVQSPGKIEEVWATLMVTEAVAVSRTPSPRPLPSATLPAVIPSATLLVVISSADPTAIPPETRFTHNQPIRLLAPGYIDIQLNGDQIFADHVELLNSGENSHQVVVTYTEDVLTDFCLVWESYCLNPRIHLTSVDFREGGVIVYGSLNLANLGWQELGLMVQSQNNGTRFTVVGVIWEDQVFLITAGSLLGQAVGDLVERGNAAFDLLSIDIGDERFHIRQMQFDDNTLRIELEQ